MNADLQRILESKAARRRKPADLPIGEKLGLLDALRERGVAIRGASPSRDACLPARKRGVAPVAILLDRRERDLILRHGFPSEDIERRLIESGDSHLVRVADSPFWWEQVIRNCKKIFIIR